MTVKISFSLQEKKFLHEFRRKLNLSEDINDVLNSFSQTVTKFLNEIFDQRLHFKPADIMFMPYANIKYKFDNRVLVNDELKSALNNSDVKNILVRFSTSAYKRCVHLNKHLEKTNSKINGPQKTH